MSVKTIGDNRSVVRLETDIEAGLETVWGLLTDFDHHAGFLPYMTKSQVVRQEEEYKLVEQEGKITILFWSYSMKDTQRVWEDEPRGMHFMAVDGDFDELQGDFRLTIPTVFVLRTHLICEFTVKPKARVPDWAVRMAAKHYLKKMVAAIARKAEENRK